MLSRLWEQSIFIKNKIKYTEIHSLKAMDGTITEKNLISVLEQMSKAKKDLGASKVKLWLHAHAPFEIPSLKLQKPDSKHFSQIVKAICSAIVYCEDNEIDFGFDAVVGKGGGFPDIREI